MDFLQRNANNHPGQPKDGAPGFNGMAGNRFNSMMGGEPQWLRVTFVVLLFSLTILAIAIALLLYFGKAKENNFVNKDRTQAVFLTNGQVYFGQLTDVTDTYVNLKDIYYLNTQQSDDNKDSNKPATTNFSLVKLGCELHGPADQMIINRDQVTFWENLKDNGKVVAAINEWRKQNPKGQECKTTTDSTQQSTGNTQTNPESNKNTNTAQ